MARMTGAYRWARRRIAARYYLRRSVSNHRMMGYNLSPETYRVYIAHAEERAAERWPE
jgi:hypothetical protein